MATVGVIAVLSYLNTTVLVEASLWHASVGATPYAVFWPLAISQLSVIGAAWSIHRVRAAAPGARDHQHRCSLASTHCVRSMPVPRLPAGRSVAARRSRSPARPHRGCWTERAAEFRKAVVRDCARLAADWLAMYPILINLVHSENVQSIAWLRRLGFEIHPARPLVAGGALFHVFTMGKPLCLAAPCGPPVLH